MTADVAFDVVCKEGLQTCASLGVDKTVNIQLLYMSKNQDVKVLMQAPHIVVDTMNKQLKIMKWNKRGCRGLCTRFRVIFAPMAVRYLRLLDDNPLNRSFTVQWLNTAKWVCTSSREGVYIDPNHSSECSCATSACCKCIKGAKRCIIHSKDEADNVYTITARYTHDEQEKHNYLQDVAQPAWHGKMTDNNVILYKVSSEHIFTVQFVMMANQVALQWYKLRKGGGNLLVNQWFKAPPEYKYSFVDDAITPFFFCQH